MTDFNLKWVVFFGAHKKESQPHLFTINNGGNHIDFQIKDNDGDTLFLEQRW